MRKTALIAYTLLLITVLATGCNPDSSSATAEPATNGSPMPPPTATVTTEATRSPTPIPQPTESKLVQVYTPSPMPTPFPTETLLPPETPGHWEYVIREGDTLGYIIQQPPFNYPYDPNVISEVVRINDNISNADNLPVPGTTILIPWPTSTPFPQMGQETPIFSSTHHVDTRTLPNNTEFGCHYVQSGETVVYIIEQYGGLTLELVSQLNPDIDFRGCNFELPSGGENCSPAIYAGQCVTVPFATPTPTPSPTPSGNETATPTPTFAAPGLIYPPENSVAPPVLITLHWVSAGILRPEEYYLVHVLDVTSGAQPWIDITRSTSLTLPEALIPVDGQTHVIEWSVFVAEANEQGLFAPVGGTALTRTFHWQSR